VIRSLRFRTLAHATEDENLIESIFLSLLPPEGTFRKFRTKGHFGNPIIYFEGSVEKKCEKHLVELLSKLSDEDLDSLERTLEMRTDEEGTFHMRFDKQKAVDSELRLTDSSDAIAVSVKIVTYPLRKEKVIEEMRGKIEEARILRSRNQVSG